MYEDIRAAGASRIRVAEDKSNEQEADSLGSVASAIGHAVEPKLNMRNFPDAFTKEATLDLPPLFDRGSLKEITIGKLLDTDEIEVRA